MSDTIEEQIRFGLRLLAAEVQPALKIQATVRRPRLVVAAAALALAILAAAAGVIDRSESRVGKLSYRPGTVFGSPEGPLLPYFETSLSDISAASARDAWIVGSGSPSYGATRQVGVAWHWDGAKWRTVAVPSVPGNVDLHSVAATADGEAWAVGWHSEPTDYRIVRALIEHWDGSRWSIAGLPRTGVSNLVSVSASGPDDVWAVGEIFGRDARGKFPDRLRRPFLLHWDGSSWGMVAVPWRLRPGEGAKVVTTGPNDVWVAAVAGEQIEHWDGVSWNAVPAPFGPHDPVWGLSATSADDAWAVGSYVQGRRSRTLAAHWDGQSWQIVPTPNRATDSALTAVVAGRADDVWAFGQSRRTGRGPVALVEHWDGRSWQIVPAATPSMWEGDPSLAATQDGVAWAIGNCYFDNVIARWNGSAWTITAHPPDRLWNPKTPLRIRHAGATSCAR